MIALDRFGNIACGNSHGGKIGRNPGKLMNQFGTRIYVDNEVAGVSFTGSNESLNFHPAHDVIKRMEYLGEHVKLACENVLNDLKQKSEISAGVIALNKSGTVAISFTTEHMPWAYQNEDKLYYGINQYGKFEENSSA